MFTVEFQTGALLLLAAAALTIAWILWCDRNDRETARVQALEGVGHEMRINLQRFMAELSAISFDEPVSAEEMLPVNHPQLDAVFANLVRGNANALSVLSATYQTLQARKADVRAALANRGNPKAEAGPAIDALLDAIVTLYLWEAHDGRRPQEAHTTREWEVRRWMKTHGLASDVFPNMHLRDEVVERLRKYGMKLTPRPLTMTAHEYYSKRYDRFADPRGPFGRRRQRTGTDVLDLGGRESTTRRLSRTLRKATP